jgi:hypothetical protein
MRDQKNIDRLFQEKLEGFEPKPRPEVWSQIQDRMQQKKKRRIPIWWWSAGIAALLILSLFVLLPKDQKNENIITDPVITVNPNTKPILDSLPKQQPQRPFEEPKTLQDNNTLLTEKTDSKSDKTESSDKKNTPRKSVRPKTEIAENVDVNDTLDKFKENNASTTSITERKENPVDANSIKSLDNTGKETTTFSNVIAKKENDDSTSTVIENNENPKSIFDTNQSKDSLQTQRTDTKKKAFYAQVDDDFLEEKTNDKKWAVRPLVALSTVASSNSSPTDQIFSNNPTSGNTAFNYGVSVAYQVNERFTIQTGVMTQNVNFDTERVSLVQTPNPPRNQLTNINLNGNLPFALAGATDAVALSDGFVTSPNVPDSDASLNQNISYIEIPVEVKYRVTESKKLRTSVIGGFSSLFLRENEVILNSNFFGRRSIGTASNLNTVNFSGNIGLELGYKIYKQLFFNVNPMVKVHLNTFSRDNNGYLPVFVGVYSGITYQF